jgi:hypothetical protein
MSDEKLTAASTLHWNDAKVNKEIARFGPDGVWVNPNLPLNEAARKFLDIVNDMWGAHFTRPAVEAERARIRAEVKDLLDQPMTLFGMWVELRRVLAIIDRKDTTHE